MADQNRRRGAGDAGDIVVLGQPVAGVIPALGVLRQIERVTERIGGGTSGEIGERSSSE